MSDEVGSGREDHQLLIVELSSLVDGELDGAQRTVVEAHLETCASCRARLEGLRAVKAWLSSDAATTADLAAPAAWNEVRAALPPRVMASRLGGWRRLTIAASLVIVAARSTMWWNAREARSPAQPEASGVAQLEALAHARLATLPAPKSRALRSSLQILDGAIADARAARAADPENEFLATYLDDLLRRKAGALREVVEMADAERRS